MHGWLKCIHSDQAITVSRHSNFTETHQVVFEFNLYLGSSTYINEDLPSNQIWAYKYNISKLKTLFRNIIWTSLKQNSKMVVNVLFIFVGTLFVLYHFVLWHLMIIGVLVLDSTIQFLRSSIVSFWIPLANSKQRNYHTCGHHWYTRNIPLLTNAGTYLQLGPKVYI